MESPRPSTFRAAMQLMRLPLVITAISNSQAALILRDARGWGDEWTFPAAASLGTMSLGLYGFGMVANDLVDMRRDQYLSPNRPLAAGAIGVQQAYLIAATLLLLGLAGGASYSLLFGGGLISLFFLAWTVALIFLYNLATKFVGAAGILTLGLIRFFHAAIGQPHLDVIWHGLLLLDHIVILSAICYWLEGKRPRLSISHRWGLGLGLLGLNLFLCGGIFLAHWWRRGTLRGLTESMAITPALIYPGIAVAVFVAFAAALLLSVGSITDKSRREQADFRRRTGRRLMVFGLIWLVVYDMAFAYGYLREF